MIAVARFWRAVDEGLLVRVRLTPRGGRDAVEGVEVLADGGTVLKVRVRAAPQAGAANAALEKLIAMRLGVPKSSASVVGGSTSRMKTLKIVGEPAGLIERAEALANANA